MDEVIKLLRERTEVCKKLEILFNELNEVLKTKSSELNESVQKIIPVMQELSKNDSASQEFLKKVGVPSMGEFIAANSSGIQREMAENLLKEVSSLQENLKKHLGAVNVLLNKGKEFVDYNLNVISQTSASNTYGAATEKENRRGRRIFEANI